MLKKIIKRIPFLVRTLEPFYIKWVRFKAELLGLGFRDWTKDDEDAVRSLWDQRHVERNYYLRDKIAKFSPQSILEVGCGCGNILSLLAKQHPIANIVGIEINLVAVECGNDWLYKEGILNVNLEVGRAEQLSKFLDKSFDVVFSSAVLMYVRQEDIKNVLSNMLRIAKKGIMLLEMHADNQKKYLGELYPPSNWKRDYRKIFNELGISNDRITIEPVSAYIWQPGGGGAAYIEVNLSTPLREGTA